MRGRGISQHPRAEVQENLSFVRHRPGAFLAPDKELRTADPQAISPPLGAPQPGLCASLAELPQPRTQVLFLSVRLAHRVNSATPQACSGSASPKRGKEQLPLK